MENLDNLLKKAIENHDYYLKQINYYEQELKLAKLAIKQLEKQLENKDELGQ